MPRQHELVLVTGPTEMGKTTTRHKMQTMDTALLQLYQKGEISYDTMMSHAHDQAFIKTRTGDSRTS